MFKDKKCEPKFANRPTQFFKTNIYSCFFQLRWFQIRILSIKFYQKQNTKAMINLIPLSHISACIFEKILKKKVVSAEFQTALFNCDNSFKSYSFSDLQTCLVIQETNESEQIVPPVKLQRWLLSTAKKAVQNITF